MRKYTVPLITLISSLALVVFLFGLGWTIQNHFFEKGNTNLSKKDTKTEEKTDVKGKTIVALGDSLTRGMGDENGKGYIGYLVDELQKKSDEKITLYNLGVKGYRSNQLFEQIQQHSIQRQIKQATTIMITIGGNDLFQSGQTLLNLDFKKVNQQKKKYLHNLQAILNDIRSINPNATIYLVGLYNPFIDLDDAKLTTKVVRQWNFDTSELLDQYKDTVFVPTFDLFQLKVNDYLYSDKFHPNAKGYKLIAERVASLITW